MGFNADKFQNAEFQHRTADVQVNGMESFFDEKEDPVWKVRSLTAAELGKVNEAAKQNRALSELVEGFMSENYTTRIESIKESLGLTDSVPDEVVRGIALLKFGSVEPACTQEMAVRLAETFPVPFYTLWRKIMELTQMGQSLGESQASGQTQE